MKVEKGEPLQAGTSS